MSLLFASQYMFREVMPSEACTLLFSAGDCSFLIFCDVRISSGSCELDTGGADPVSGGVHLCHVLAVEVEVEVEISVQVSGDLKP